MTFLGDQTADPSHKNSDRETATGDSPEAFPGLRDPTDGAEQAGLSASQDGVDLTNRPIDHDGPEKALSTPPPPGGRPPATGSDGNGGTDGDDGHRAATGSDSSNQSAMGGLTPISIAERVGGGVTGIAAFVRDKAINPANRIAKIIGLAILGSIVLASLSLMFVNAAIRGLTLVIGRAWISELALAGIFLITGAVLWRLRRVTKVD